MQFLSTAPVLINADDKVCRNSPDTTAMGRKCDGGCYKNIKESARMIPFGKTPIVELRYHILTPSPRRCVGSGKG